MPAVSIARAGGRWGRARPQVLLFALALPGLLFAAVLFAMPMLRLLAFSLENGNSIYYERALDPLYIEVMWRTFRLAGIITLASLLLGYPLAHFLATASRGWRTIGFICLLLPFWTSLLVRTYAWMILLGNNGIVNKLLQWAHFTDKPLPLMGNEFGVAVGMVHVLMPYMVFPIYGVMVRMDRTLLAAARGLGASHWNILRLIYLPLTMPGVASGCVLVFILASGFFITPALLGSGHVMMISLLIEQQVNKILNLGFAAALCVILLVSTLALYSLFQARLNAGAGHE